MKYVVWVHASALAGYEPAMEHLGWVQPFGTDGKQIEALNPAPDSSPVAGWRTSCECGWQGSQYYPRAEFPCVDDKKPHGDPPPAVQGDAVTGAEGEWRDHVEAVLPEVRVFDLLDSGIRPTHNAVRTVVAWARTAGVSWPRIAAAVGMTPAQAKSVWATQSHRSVRGSEFRPATDQAQRRDPRGRGPER